MYKITSLYCASLISLPIIGMHMDEKKITPLNESGIAPESNNLTPKHHICVKGCVCLWCFPPALTADILCACPLFCRLTPIQGNESDIEWMDRAHSNHGVAAEHKTTQKEKHGNDACSSLKRKINALLYEKAPHHTERCEAEYEHLCCFTKAICKFAQE